ncbi:unnamed protein product [Amoebophrya sp. A25]|nr:unnamed protein product [Amoebophrya sp. A25]|eukprot:GSA25T00003238001.1
MFPSASASSRATSRGNSPSAATFFRPPPLGTIIAPPGLVPLPKNYLGSPGSVSCVAASRSASYGSVASHPPGIAYDYDPFLDASSSSSCFRTVVGSRTRSGNYLQQGSGRGSHGPPTPKNQDHGTRSRTELQQLHEVRYQRKNSAPAASLNHHAAAQKLAVAQREYEQVQGAGTKQTTTTTATVSSGRVHPVLAADIDTPTYYTTHEELTAEELQDLPRSSSSSGTAPVARSGSHDKLEEQQPVLVQQALSSSSQNEQAGEESRRASSSTSAFKKEVDIDMVEQHGYGRISAVETGRLSGSTTAGIGLSASTTTANTVGSKSLPVTAKTKSPAGADDAAGGGHRGGSGSTTAATSSSSTSTCNFTSGGASSSTSRQARGRPPVSPHYATATVSSHSRSASKSAAGGAAGGAGGGRVVPGVVANDEASVDRTKVVDPSRLLGSKGAPPPSSSSRGAGHLAQYAEQNLLTTPSSAAHPGVTSATSAHTGPSSSVPVKALAPASSSEVLHKSSKTAIAASVVNKQQQVASSRTPSTAGLRAGSTPPVQYVKQRLTEEPDVYPPPGESVVEPVVRRSSQQVIGAKTTASGAATVVTSNKTTARPRVNSGATTARERSISANSAVRFGLDIPEMLLPGSGSVVIPLEHPRGSKSTNLTPRNGGEHSVSATALVLGPRAGRQAGDFGAGGNRSTRRNYSREPPGALIQPQQGSTIRGSPTYAGASTALSLSAKELKQVVRYREADVARRRESVLESRAILEDRLMLQGRVQAELQALSGKSARYERQARNLQIETQAMANEIVQLEESIASKKRVLEEETLPELRRECREEKIGKEIGPEKVQAAVDELKAALAQGKANYEKAVADFRQKLRDDKSQFERDFGSKQGEIRGFQKQLESLEVSLKRERQRVDHRVKDNASRREALVEARSILEDQIFVARRSMHSHTRKDAARAAGLEENARKLEVEVEKAQVDLAQMEQVLAEQRNEADRRIELAEAAEAGFSGADEETEQIKAEAIAAVAEILKKDGGWKWNSGPGSKTSTNGRPSLSGTQGSTSGNTTPTTSRKGSVADLVMAASGNSWNSTAAASTATGLPLHERISLMDPRAADQLTSDDVLDRAERCLMALEGTFEEEVAALKHFRQFCLSQVSAVSMVTPEFELNNAGRISGSSQVKLRARSRLAGKYASELEEERAVSEKFQGGLDNSDWHEFLSSEGEDEVGEEVEDLQLSVDDLRLGGGQQEVEARAVEQQQPSSVNVEPPSIEQHQVAIDQHVNVSQPPTQQQVQQQQVQLHVSTSQQEAYRYPYDPEQEYPEQKTLVEIDVEVPDEEHQDSVELDLDNCGAISVHELLPSDQTPRMLGGATTGTTLRASIMQTGASEDIYTDARSSSYYDPRSTCGAAGPDVNGVVRDRATMDSSPGRRYGKAVDPGPAGNRETNISLLSVETRRGSSASAAAPVWATPETNISTRTSFGSMSRVAMISGGGGYVYPEQRAYTTPHFPVPNQPVQLVEHHA